MKTNQEWLEVWEKNEIPFHEMEFHPWLVKYFSRLGLQREQKVFVPLCGKSLDMRFLGDQGLHVRGVELSSSAIKSFFLEQELEPALEEGDPFRVYRSLGYELLEGDLFDLEEAHLKDIHAVYDRASLIALDPETRKRYVAQFKKHLRSGTQYFLITLEYDQCVMTGPPFSVTEAEVQQLFGDWCQIEVLESKAVEEIPSRLQEKGVKQLFVKAHLLQVR